MSRFCMVLAGGLALGALSAGAAFAGDHDSGFAAALLDTQKGLVYVDPKFGKLLSYPVTPEQQAMKWKVYSLLQAQTPTLPMRVTTKGVIAVTLHERMAENASLVLTPTGVTTQCDGAKFEDAHAKAADAHAAERSQDTHHQTTR